MDGISQEPLDRFVSEYILLKILELAKADMPKKSIYTDYSHYYIEDAEGIEHPPYPQYAHVPTDKEWRTWTKKWFGDMLYI